MEQTKEPQYDITLKYRDEHGLEPLGLMINQAWYDDPKRLSFTFSRYKFVAKMLAGSKNVLEIGCADAFCSRIVLQDVEKLTVTDFDPIFIDDVKARQLGRWKFEDAFVHDILAGPVSGSFDGIYALDVLEHIPPAEEHGFMLNLIASLTPHGSVIIGMPSEESQAHASAVSKAGHVNCQTMPVLKETMGRYFHNVFMFSMNDEIVHTGYHKMAQYLMAVCCGKIDSSPAP